MLYKDVYTPTEMNFRNLSGEEELDYNLMNEKEELKRCITLVISAHSRQYKNGSVPTSHFQHNVLIHIYTGTTNIKSCTTSVTESTDKLS